MTTTRGKAAIQALGPGLSEEARKAMNAAFDALSDWRNEIASTAERNSATVFDKMAAAAKAVGWPADFVDVTRQQMQQASRMQMQVMDQVMDIWEQQMKQPGSAFSVPEALKGKSPPFMGGFGGFGGSQGFPGMDMSNLSMSPLQFWMQAAEMWQKNWASAMQSWMDMQKSAVEQIQRSSKLPGQR